MLAFIFLTYIDEPQITSLLEKAGQSTEEAAAVVESDYQAISTKEEADLSSLMSECSYAISDAEAFTEKLSKDLSVLDGVKIPEYIASKLVESCWLKILKIE